MPDAPFRERTRELERTRDLLRLMPAAGSRALDVGSRDGHIARHMAKRIAEVVAVDLVCPPHRAVAHPVHARQCQGNATQLPFETTTVDYVQCSTEVLEHIPSTNLALMCEEFQRVCAGRLLVGVPYWQDLRVGRLTCTACGQHNPPGDTCTRSTRSGWRPCFPIFESSSRRSSARRATSPTSFRASCSIWPETPMAPTGRRNRVSTAARRLPCRRREPCSRRYARSSVSGRLR
ncbi:MAG: class I SAM-dependent methyltransferase [Rubrivivax sp.]|nr:class I SAM-dependent methyltransferase [Rubrivivax sp.]